MGKLYSARMIAELIGIDSVTVKNWESLKLIPEGTRMGLQRKRIWGKAKVLLILEFARDNGYPIPDRVFEQVRGA